MSLQLILGGSGTGKSTRLYQMIVRQSVQFPDEKIFLMIAGPIFEINTSCDFSNSSEGL